MRKLFLPFAFVSATTAVACSFEMSTRGASQPAPPPPSASAPPQATAGQPAPAEASRPTVARMGSVKKGTGAATATPPTTGAPTGAPPPAVPTGTGAWTPPVLAGTNLFGTGTPDPAGWKGSMYFIASGATKLPDLQTATPSGLLFAKELNVSPKAMTGGFPGIDPNRNSDFAIRWEAPLFVDNEADYTFRLLADDGARVSIDGTLIVDHDGVHDPATEKSGPVHLVKGTHAIAVDYFQTKGNVALQLFCKRQGMDEKICPTRL